MSTENSINELDAELERSLSCIAEKEGLHSFDIVNVSGTIKGDGYVGVITRIRIDGTDRFGNPKHIHLITKSGPKSKILREAAPITDIFEREIYMYKTVLPSLIDFEREKNVTNPFKSIAKCYKTLAVEFNEVIILENLKEIGYDLWNRKLRMDGEHVELVFKEYGKFHALSFALRDQRPETFSKLVLPLDELLFTFFEKSGMDKTMQRYCLKALNVLDQIVDKESYPVFQKFTDDVINGLQKVISPNTDEYSAILHGDCWSGNMMFKYEKVNQAAKPSNVRLLDWQISRVGSPVLDLSYFFYGNSSNDVIINFKYYLQHYYNSFSAHLIALGSDPEKVYPFEKLEEHWRKYSKFGLLMSTALVYVANSEKDEVMDFTEVLESGGAMADAFNYDSVNDHKSDQIIKNLINHFVKNKFI